MPFYSPGTFLTAGGRPEARGTDPQILPLDARNLGLQEPQAGRDCNGRITMCARNKWCREMPIRRRSCAGLIGNDWKTSVQVERSRWRFLLHVHALQRYRVDWKSRHAAHHCARTWSVMSSALEAAYEAHQLGLSPHRPPTLPLITDIAPPSTLPSPVQPKPRTIHPAARAFDVTVRPCGCHLSRTRPIAGPT